MDRVSKSTRSRIMSRIRSKGNLTTEKRLRAYLVQAGIRGWHMHDKSLPGTPDFVFDKQKVAVFVDGCFWHGCPQCGKRSKTHKKFWDEKISNNLKRDQKTRRQLRRAGWSVVRIWEHETKTNPRRALLRLVNVHRKRTKQKL